jgi:hypothetical protein
VNIKRCLSVLVLIAVFFTYTTMDLRAAALQTPDTPHAVSSQDLHKAVQASDLQATANRKAVQNFFARPEVSAQIQRVGIAPDRISSSVALLSDSEVLRLNQQIMAMDLQKETTGLGAGAIVAIVLGGVALLILICYLLYRDAEDNGYHYSW